jgi:hypothetical protein
MQAVVVLVPGIVRVELVIIRAHTAALFCISSYSSDASPRVSLYMHKARQWELKRQI